MHPHTHSLISLTYTHSLISPVFEAMALADGVAEAAAPVAAGTLLAGLADEDVATPTTAAAIWVGARAVVTETTPPTPPAPPLGCKARASITGVPATGALTVGEDEAITGEAVTAVTADDNAVTDGTIWLVAPGVVAMAVAVRACLGCRM